MAKDSKNIRNFDVNYQVDFDYIDGKAKTNRNFFPINNQPVKNCTTPSANLDVKPFHPSKQVVVNKTQVKKTKPKRSIRTGSVIRIVALVLVFGWLAFLFFDLLSTWY